MRRRPLQPSKSAAPLTRHDGIQLLPHVEPRVERRPRDDLAARADVAERVFARAPRRRCGRNRVRDALRATDARQPREPRVAMDFNDSDSGKVTKYTITLNDYKYTLGYKELKNYLKAYKKSLCF